MTLEALTEIPPRSARLSGFADWRARLDRERIPPVIAVAGSRGKTSVLRVVESILRAGNYRFASWTDGGVEIEGHRQQGELGPWSRVKTRLTSGGLDVALREIDWATLHAIGVPGRNDPIVAVVNLCANNEACLITPEIIAARGALSRVRDNVSSMGYLILSADDFAVSGQGNNDSADRFLVGISPDTPVLRRHIQRGGDACWLEKETIVVRENLEPMQVIDIRELPWTRAGTIPFATQNALFATAIARCCGLPYALIESGLRNHIPQPATSPGSFNIFEWGSALVIVDRPAPSWFLRTTLRAVGNLGPGRQIRVAGQMADVPTEDLAEVGRLLGRNGGVLIVHGAWTEERLHVLRLGASSNDVPPLFLQAPGEHAALRQATAMLRSNDVLLVLAEDAPAVLRLVEQQRNRAVLSATDSAGAA